MSDAVPREFRMVAELLRSGLPPVLGSNLVGIYVYGSALDTSFVPGRSDFDCLVVTAGSIDAAEFASLEGSLTAAQAEMTDIARTQISFLVRDRVLQDDPSACTYQFGRLMRSGSDGNPIVWLDFLRRGLVLHGPHPSRFLPDISRELLDKALVRELGYLREEVVENPESEWRDRNTYRAYAVLTLCRILYTAATGEICSKTQAAEWAIAELKDEPVLQDLIRVAREVSDEMSATSVPRRPIERFIGYVSSQIGV